MRRRSGITFSFTWENMKRSERPPSCGEMFVCLKGQHSCDMLSSRAEGELDLLTFMSTSCLTGRLQCGVWVFRSWNNYSSGCDFQSSSYHTVQVIMHTSVSGADIFTDFAVDLWPCSWPPGGVVGNVIETSLDMGGLRKRATQRPSTSDTL